MLPKSFEKFFGPVPKVKYASVKRKGQTVDIDPQEVKRRIEAGLPDSEVHVEGDGQHFNAVIVCAAFAGKSMLEQHRMVYDTLGPAMGGVHALSIRTYTPEQWQRSKAR